MMTSAEHSKCNFLLDVLRCGWRDHDKLIERARDRTDLSDSAEYTAALTFFGSAIQEAVRALSLTDETREAVRRYREYLNTNANRDKHPAGELLRLATRE